MILRVNGLSFRYNGTPVLEDISFDVRAHEITAILGPNGAGKTTLLRSINGILSPRGGSVYIDETDILASSPKEIAKKTAYVAQQSEPGRVTAFDAVLLGRKPYLGWRITKDDIDRAHYALRSVDMEHLSLRYVDSMSGGEYQKVCIARSVAQEPTVMLLDEPTSSLDLKNQVAVLRLLRGIVREHPMCVVMSMHDLNTAFRYADKFIFLKDGKIYSAVDKSGIHGGIIEEVYGIPVEVHRYGAHPVVVPVDESEGEEEQ